MSRSTKCQFEYYESLNLEKLVSLLPLFSAANECMLNGMIKNHEMCKTSSHQKLNQGL